MATTTTLTPTSAVSADAPKLLKKASMADIKSPTTPTQTSFGCKHIKDFLTQARDKATSEYARLLQCIRDSQNVSGQIYKHAGGSGGAVASDIPTYLCIQCPTVIKSREKHRKDHIFSVESQNGFIFCHDCHDFVYDPTFEAVRSSDNVRKRKRAALTSDEKKLIAANSTPVPCSATGLRGLYNMGQTCFMSVVIQSLIHNPFVRAFYMAEGHKREDCEREACTACALDHMFNEFYGEEKHEGYGAVNLLQACWKECQTQNNSLMGYSQQDAHEFFGFILNSLHAGIEDEDESQTSSVAAKKCECIIHMTFGGAFKSTVTCSNCNKQSHTTDPFMDLSLDIRSAPTIKKKKLALINGTATTREIPPMDLTECLDRFTSEETLSADSYTCRKCNSSQEARKKLALSRCPWVVPIHLKRFSHSKTLKESTKVETRIRFPTSLDLRPFVASSAAKSKSQSQKVKDEPDSDSDDDDDPSGTLSGNPSKSKDKDKDDPPDPPPQPVYDLVSVIVHKGKMETGHYIAYCRQGPEWFRFDDSMVVQVGEKEVLSAEAYMLFYCLAKI